MFCPECRTEYRPGATRCTDCGAELVAELPPLPEVNTEWEDLVSVLETDDPSLLAVARSLLEAEGIPCYARGDRLQDLIGLGRIGVGYNVAFGPVHLEVPREYENQARDLLAAQPGEAEG